MIEFHAGRNGAILGFIVHAISRFSPLSDGSISATVLVPLPNPARRIVASIFFEAEVRGKPAVVAAHIANRLTRHKIAFR
jgi:hypothetical protein